MTHTQADDIESAVQAWCPEPWTKRRFVLGNDHALVVAVDNAMEDQVRVLVATDAPGELWLHWGVARKRKSQWEAPAKEIWPAGSRRFDDRAVRSPLVREKQSSKVARLEIVYQKKRDALPRTINFVVYDAASQTWLKDHGRDMHVPLPHGEAESGDDIGKLIETIAEAEVGDHSWTLMHRFNLCHELIEEVDQTSDESNLRQLGVLFAWLRYSALRQLTWQRNYNTQPRELAHSQDRLTRQIASRFKQADEPGAICRMMLATLGRGGEGQAIRDEILHIMHRHGIKESHGTWMEQWHQKLHNNTTPDDVTICEAYLAFLRSGGDIKAYDQVLEAEGIGRDRLAHFDRPITADPTYYGDRKEALTEAFEDFLNLLRSVHSGTDLSSSLKAAAHCLDEDFRNVIAKVAEKKVETSEQLLRVADELVDSRRQLIEKISESKAPGAGVGAEARRDMLYVDLSVEQRLRKAIEGFDLSQMDSAPLIRLVGLVSTAADLSWPETGFPLAARHVKRLSKLDMEDRLTLLEAVALVERLGWEVQKAADRLHDLIQPLAERLGRALEVESWTVPIFSEEVIRGTLLFVMSRVLRRLEVLLRKKANIGGWQIVSPGQATGRVHVVSALREVQSRHFDEPTIVIAEEISGDEELPEGVQAVVGREPVDLVSHVAVRARNSKVLLAGCLEEETYQSLCEREGERIAMRSTAEGHLTFEEAADDDEQELKQDQAAKVQGKLAKVKLEAGVLTAESFSSDRVGAKAMNLVRLAQAMNKDMPVNMSEDVNVPRGVALAFGTFEAAMDRSENREVRQSYQALLKQVDDSPGEILSKLRDCIASLKPWDELENQFAKAGEQAGLAMDENFSVVFRAIARVWASQWTDRAYWSRRRLGIAHDTLHMAVLIQEMIPADLAFVLHTVNPITGNREELLGEVVSGLGETLVSNEPGQALAFTANKEAPDEQTILSFPSKSDALRGGGLICRSDSNGEDLAAYAGAGLYDSFPVISPKREPIDATKERMVTDATYRTALISRLTELGVAIEKQFGCAQDIEGAVWGGEGGGGEDIYVVQTRPQVGL